MFGGSESQLFWPLLSRLAPPITVSSVQDMENITSEIGRVSKPILLTTSDNSPPKVFLWTLPSVPLVSHFSKRASIIIVL